MVRKALFSRNDGSLRRSAGMRDPWLCGQWSSWLSVYRAKLARRVAGQRPAFLSILAQESRRVTMRLKTGRPGVESGSAAK